MGLMPAFMRRLIKPKSKPVPEVKPRTSLTPICTLPRTEPTLSESGFMRILANLNDLSRWGSMKWCCASGEHSDYTAHHRGDVYGVTIYDYGQSYRIKTIVFKNGKTGEIQCYDMPRYTLTANYNVSVVGRRDLLVVRSTHLARSIMNSVEQAVAESTKRQYLNEIPPPPRAPSRDDSDDLLGATLFAFASLTNKPAESESANDLTTKGGDFAGAGASDTWSEPEPIRTSAPEPTYEAPTYTAGDSGSSYESSSDSSSDSSSSSSSD